MSVKNTVFQWRGSAPSIRDFYLKKATLRGQETPTRVGVIFYAGMRGFDTVRRNMLPAYSKYSFESTQLKQKKTGLQMQTCFLWLGRKNLFQTFEQQDEVEIEQEIKEIRELLDEGGD